MKVAQVDIAPRILILILILILQYTAPRILILILILNRIVTVHNNEYGLTEQYSRLNSCTNVHAAQVVQLCAQVAGYRR